MTQLITLMHSICTLAVNTLNASTESCINDNIQTSQLIERCQVQKKLELLQDVLSKLFVCFFFLLLVSRAVGVKF